MSNIAQNLQKILSAIYGKDVRQAIHDSIEDCYNDGRSGATDLTARQMLMQISPSVNALIASNRALDTLELTVTDPIDSSFELYTDGVPLKLYITGNVVSLDGVLKTAGTIAGSSTEQLILSLSATLGAEFGDDAPKYYPQRKTRFVSNGSGSAKFMLTIDTSSNVYFSRYNDYKDTSADYVASVPSGSFVPVHAMWVCEGVPIDNAVGVVTDKTLSIEDMPADAKAVGDALGSASGGGLSNEAKQALLNCFEHVAWIDEHGQDYYDALEEALYPPANLVSISAVYTQSGTVYDTDTLDSLKTDLVVTATYDDSSTATVTSYTLSGTLTTGTSTITVSYGGKTTTFNVTVTHQEHAWLYNWDFTQSLTDSVESNTATTSATFTSGTGITYDTTLQVTSFALTEMATNSDSLLGKSVEIDIELSTQKGGNNRRILSLYGSNSGQQAVFTYRGGTWQFYTGTAWDTNPTYSNSFDSASYDFFNGKTVKLHISSAGYLTAYSKTRGADDSTYIKLFESSVTLASSVLTNPRNCSVGQNGGNDSIANGTLLAFRIFEETI